MLGLNKFCSSVPMKSFELCFDRTCLVSVDTDETSQSERSHLDQYCQMFCRLLEQTQCQCFNVVFFFFFFKLYVLTQHICQC